MSETLLNIELTDFDAIKIVCSQCAASVELPVARFQGDSPDRCFHCRAVWFPANSSRATALEHLFRALVELRQRGAQTECHVQFVMRPEHGPSHSRART